MKAELEKLFDQQIEPGSLVEWDAADAKTVTQVGLLVSVCLVCSNPGIVNRHAVIASEGDLHLFEVKRRLACSRCKCRGQSEMFVGKPRC